MSSHDTPYLERNPGDMVTAEDWNEVQVLVKEDIAAKTGEVQTALDEHSQEPVDAAKFGGQTPDEWSAQFAPKVHDHEGTAVYRRYYKRFEVGTEEVFVHHKMGRYPLVDAYVMRTVINPADFPESEITSSDGGPVRFFLYYAHEEAERFNQNEKVFRERAPRGAPLAQLVQEMGVEWELDDTLQDVRNELWDALGTAPNDEMGHAASPWIEEKCIERLTIQELIDNDEWQDIRLAFIAAKPELCCGQPPRDPDAPEPMLHVQHINYDTLLVAAANLPDGANRTAEPYDVMLLLRS